MHKQAQLQCDTLGATIESLEEALSPPPPPVEESPDGECLHPPQYRNEIPGMGKNRNRFQCTRCDLIGGIE
jgi:hypothetical protein